MVDDEITVEALKKTRGRPGFGSSLHNQDSEAPVLGFFQGRKDIFDPVLIVPLC